MYARLARRVKYLTFVSNIVLPNFFAFSRRKDTASLNTKHSDFKSEIYKIASIYNLCIEHDKKSRARTEGVVFTELQVLPIAVPHVELGIHKARIREISAGAEFTRYLELRATRYPNLSHDWRELPWQELQSVWVNPHSSGRMFKRLSLILAHEHCGQVLFERGIGSIDASPIPDTKLEQVADFIIAGEEGVEEEKKELEIGLTEETKDEILSLVANELKDSDEVEHLIEVDDDPIEHDGDLHVRIGTTYKEKAFIKCFCNGHFESRFHWIFDCPKLGTPFLEDVSNTAKAIAGDGPLGLEVHETAKKMIRIINAEEDVERKAKYATGFLPVRLFRSRGDEFLTLKKIKRKKKVRKYVYTAFMQAILKRWRARCEHFASENTEF